MAELDPEHWLVVDGRGSPTEIAEVVRAGVTERLGLP
jgi:hypothetical protein